MTHRAVPKDDLTLREIQSSQPWDVPYEFDRGPLVGFEGRGLMARHTVLHAMKTVGEIAAQFEEVDHRTGCESDAQINRILEMAADLVTEGVRLANLYGCDLQAILERRVLAKNGRGFTRSE